MRKDMMQAFELYQPDNLDAALSLADRYGDEGWLFREETTVWTGSRIRLSGLLLLLI